MKIDDIEIGVGVPPYIIAEMSGNHQGSLEKAMELDSLMQKAHVEHELLSLFPNSTDAETRF